MTFGVWLAFAYWLYSGKIYPALNSTQVKTGWITVDSIAQPIVFSWSGETPILGNSFSKLKLRLELLDSLDNFIVISGSYFLDERASVAAGDSLAERRVRNVVRMLDIPLDRSMVIIDRAEMRGDEKGKYFEAVTIAIHEGTLLFQASENLCRVCFPDQNIDRLPVELQERVLNWIKHTPEFPGLEIKGTADGTHIAESSDRAMDRAMAIKRLIEKGIGPLHIDINTEQSTSVDPVLNRCAFIEKI